MTHVHWATTLSFVVKRNTNNLLACCVGERQDTMRGGIGKDTISGGNGKDLIVGGKGKDTLYGGVGTDTIDGNEGADLVFACEDQVTLTDKDTLVECV